MLRSTFLGFQTASRALTASQICIDVTGNNIANADTEGYTRQRVDLVSISSGGYSQKYMVTGASVGYGVAADGISQLRDPFLDLRFRTENAESGKLETIVSGLSDLENIFDETTSEGLQTQLTNLLTQLQTFSNTPTSSDIASIVRTAAQQVAQIMNTYSQQIDQVRDQEIYGLKTSTVENDFNSLVKNIASLNEQIREDQTHGNPSNELMDRRNTLIDELSKLANIQVSSTPVKISESITIDRVSISLYDASTGTSIGLVDDALYNTLSVDTTGDAVSIDLNSSFGAHETKDITDHITGGAIKGYLDIINGGGAFADETAGENTFKGVPYYKATLDTFAAKFAQVFNDMNALEDTSTTPSTITPKPLFEASDGGTEITAGNIQLTDAWLDDATYLTTTKDPDASSGGSDNILKMIQAMNSGHTFLVDPADSSSILFEGSFEQFVSGTISDLALDVSLHQSYTETSGTVLSNLFNERESLSGVSLDEEGVNLLAYEKAYNAAARFMTVIDEAVDTLLSMGLVGR